MLYTRDFHKSIENDEYPQAVRLSEYIASYMKPEKFFDFGCSTGLYLREIKSILPDIESKGFEFSPDAVESALCTDVTQCDLTLDLNLEKTDNTLGLCLEVLEHIDDQHWLPVLKNMTKLCDTIIFSAAIPGQGGVGHINCRPKIDWVKRFHSLGWVVDVDKTVHIINVMKSGYHMGWFTNNVVILVKY